MSAKTVLFVDDDAQFLEMLQSLASAAKGDHWNVLAAETTAQALTLVESHPVDLMVIDFRMPVIDGVQFLQLVQRKHQRVKTALLSGFLDANARALAAQAGADLVLEKPVSAEGFQSVLAALDELLRWKQEEGFRGVLRRVGIEDVLQMECLSRHSLILQVSSPTVRGRIYVRKGDLVHAVCGDQVGQPALEELLALRGGEFHHAAYVEPPQESLEGSWEFLLMEAVRKRDELAAGAAELEKAAVAEMEEGGAADMEEAAVAEGERAGAAEVEEVPVPVPVAAVDSDVEPEAPAGPLPGVSEMVVCTETGELLHAWQSPQAAQRCAALATLQEFARRIEGMMPVGPLERVEFYGEPERVVARLSTQGGIFVRGIAEHG